MKFKVAKQDLLKAINAVTPVLSTSGSDLSTHYLFRRVESEANKLEVLAFSGKLFASCPMTVQFEDDKQEMFTIVGGRFQTWLKGIPEVVITFDYADHKTIVTLPDECNMKVPEILSLDVSAWPFWDGRLTEAVETSNLDSSRLISALEYVNKFVADDESKLPDLCMCAIKNGVIYATDRLTATSVEVAGLEKSNFNIHKTEIRNVINFLPDEGNIIVKEYPNGVTFWREDGAVLGCGSPLATFPFFKSPGDADYCTWTLNTKELLDALPSLYAWAADDDIRLIISQDTTTKAVVFSMASASGPGSSIKKLTCLGESMSEGPFEIPAAGFAISYKKLQEILIPLKGVDAVFGVNPLKNKGYLRFTETRFADADGKGGDKYLTLVVWLS